MMRNTHQNKNLNENISYMAVMLDVTETSDGFSFPHTLSSNVTLSNRTVTIATTFGPMRHTSCNVFPKSLSDLG